MKKYILPVIALMLCTNMYGVIFNRPIIDLHVLNRTSNTIFVKADDDLVFTVLPNSDEVFITQLTSPQFVGRDSRSFYFNNFDKTKALVIRFGPIWFRNISNNEYNLEFIGDDRAKIWDGEQFKSNNINVITSKCLNIKASSKKIVRGEKLINLVEFNNLNSNENCTPI